MIRTQSDIGGDDIALIWSLLHYVSDARPQRCCMPLQAQ